MLNPVAIEDVQTMRRRQGMDDVQLRERTRGLRVGDLVKLIFLSAMEAYGGEPLLVRIPRIQGSAVCGRLVSEPTSAGLPGLRVGSPLAFSAAHIHAVPQRRPSA